ncbi:MAG: hypothetical protein WC119_00470 [Synergistaceae bacterium]
MVKKIMKKRGRPPKKATAPKKVSKKKSSRAKKSFTECVQAGKKAPKKAVAPKKAGKRAKSNKDILSDKPKLSKRPKCPRGNPNFIKKRKPTECNLEPSPTLKVFKILGYCSGTECNGIVTTGDYEDKKKGIVCCVSCGKRQKVTRLRKNIKRAEKPSKDFSRNNRNDLDDITIPHDGLLRDIPDIPDEFRNIKIGEEWD